MWNKIDTAPKDGSHILLLIDGQAIEGWWYVPTWEAEPEWTTVSLDSHGCGCCAKEDPEPTHWVALPEMEKTDA
jgi:hypothetical protein